MDRPEYSSFRLLVHRRGTSGAPYYIAINRIKGFSASDGSGTDLFVGGIASSSSVFSGVYPPSAAFIDGSTYWSSAAAAGSSQTAQEWLQYDLPGKVPLGSIHITASNNIGQIPQDFEILGSNDKVNWTSLIMVRDADLPAIFAGTVISMVNKGIQGVALTDVGGPANTVLVMDWASKQILSQISPDSEGWWGCPIQGGDVAVITFGPSGTKPEADGPVSSEVYSS